ncbi:transcriptional regulator [Raoultella planticola]|nr:transcriptional regulator [Raoultella planticola]
MCGWAQSRIGNYESGIRRIDVNDAITLSKYLGMEPSELMFGKDDSTPICHAVMKKITVHIQKVTKERTKKMLRAFNRRLKEINEFVEKIA